MSQTAINPLRVEHVRNNLKLLTFPGGFKCYTNSSEQETTLVYNEIFVEREYLPTQLSLASSQCVLDVGANIGLFTVFVKMQNPDLVVHAFEPIRSTFDVLVQNVALHRLSQVKLHNCGLGRADDVCRTMTVYPNASGNATAWPEMKWALRKLVSQAAGEGVGRYLFQSPRREKVPIRTIESVICTERIESIDLVKIDVEGDELCVLQGIAVAQYGRIRHISAEVHSLALRTAVKKFLSGKGFLVREVTGVASPWAANYVYASQESTAMNR